MVNIDDTNAQIAVRYGGVSTVTYVITGHYKKKEEPEDFYEQEDFEYRKREESFAVKNFNNALPSKSYVKYVKIKPKRFKQKIR